MAGLFRQQAVEAQKQKLHGDVLLAQPISIYVSATVLLAVVVAIAFFLSFSHYARKETVRGYLIPDKGLIESYANRSGNIEILHVSEGDTIKKGSPLATIVLNRSMLSSEELSESLIDELKLQQTLLTTEQKVNQSLLAKEAQRLNNSITDSNHALNVPSNLEALQLKQQAQHQKLFDGYLSTLDHQSQQQKLITVRQDKVQIQSQFNDALPELDILPSQFALKVGDIERRRSELKRQIDETENNYRFVIRAPEAGTVASIQVVEGEFIASNRPLVSLIPEGAKLVAELLLPTRSAGFVS